MERTQRILERFPDFYQTWNPNSLIYNIISSMGKQLDESDKELLSIMRGHWVDTAQIKELDQLGCIFNVKRKHGDSDIEYRTRLKRAIIEYKGGGTINAILTSVRMALGLPSDYPIELIENPPIEVYKEFIVKPGDTWDFNSASVDDAIPTVEISIESDGEKIIKPTLISIDAEETITYDGTIGLKQKLIISEKKAELAGKSVKSKVDGGPPTLLRKMSSWSYSEPISQEIGVFDAGVFDEAKFAVGITSVKVGFRWTAMQPATFEIKLPKEAVKDNLSLAEDAVNAIKATGVKAIISVV